MKFRFLKHFAFSLVVLFTAASCISDDDLDNGENPYENVAFGAIVNASPSSGSLMFFADDNLINTTGISFGESAGYYNFLTGDRTLTLKSANGTELATADITLEEADYFSAFAVNTFDNIELVTYNDSLVYPPQGQALIRFINLSPDAPAIDVDAETPAQNYAAMLEFKEATDFMAIPGGFYNFVFSNSQTEEEIYTENTVEINAGHIYTLYTKGFVNPPANSNDTFDVEKLRNY